MGFGFSFGFPSKNPLEAGPPPSEITGDLTETLEAVSEGIVGTITNSGVITEVLEAVTEDMTGDLDETQTLRIRTWFASTTWTPTTSGPTVLECWGGGGGGTTATNAGGGATYARVDAYTRTAGVGITVTIGAGGAVPGGTGGNTSFDSTCIAVGAIGNAGGVAASCTGDVTRSGGAGEVGSGSCTGGGAAGSSTAAGTTPVPGEPDGGAGSSAVANGARVPGGGGRSSASIQGPGAQGLARATYTVPATAGLPVLIGATLQRSIGTSHGVTVPTGNAGDTILYFVFSDGTPTIGLSGGSPTSVLSVTSGTCKLEVISNGESGAPTTVTTSVSETVTIIVMRWSDLTTVSGSTASATGTNADPPSHDMGTSAATVWITGIVTDATTGAGDVTGAPTGFEDILYGPILGPSGTIGSMIAWMAETAQTKDPGTFTNASIVHATFTMGLRS